MSTKAKMSRRGGAYRVASSAANGCVGEEEGGAGKKEGKALVSRKQVNEKNSHTSSNKTYGLPKMTSQSFWPVDAALVPRTTFEMTRKRRGWW